MIKHTIILFLFVFLSNICHGQIFPEKGVPFLKNYSPSTYQNKGKVWDIETSPNGIVYFASDKGLLEFDGSIWNSFTGSKGVTRSILIINDSVLYSGSDMDFGIWHRTRLNEFEYKSLYPFKEEVQEDIEEFWNIFQTKEMIVFVSSRNIYLYKNDQITRIKAPVKISSCFKHQDTLFFSGENADLHFFDGFDFQNITNSLNRSNINFIGKYINKKNNYLVSKNDGLFLLSGNSPKPINSSLSNKLKNAKVFSFEQIGQHHLAFGTILKGLIITDLDGNIIHNINKIKGLLSNTILAINNSKSGKLWVAMDYGVSSLSLFDNITYFYDYRGDFGTGSVAWKLNEMFYLGTNQGLYSTTWQSLNDDKEFTDLDLIPGSEGQVWSLHYHDELLFIGHDHGLFSLHKNQISHLYDQDGIWTIIPYEDKLLAGTYNGVSIFSKSNGQWFFDRKMDMISGSCDQLIIQDKRNLWVNIPNFGIVNIELSNALDPIDQKIYLKNTFIGNETYIVNREDTIYVLTDEKVYKFNSDKAEFQECDNIFSRTLPYDILPGVYQPYSLGEDHAFFPIYNGFALKHLNSKFQFTYSIKPQFRKLVAYNNNSQIELPPKSEIPFKLNNIKIDYVLPNLANAQYQYKLGEDGKWSNWSSENSIDLVGLEAGDYNLHLRAKTDIQSFDTVIYSFTILNPWYQTWIAYVIYVMIFLSLVYFLVLFQKNALKKARLKMKLQEKESINQINKKHHETLEKINQERIQKEYEQLKQQLKDKTVELANKSKETEDKNRLLISMREKFVEIQENPQMAKSKMGEIRRLLNSHITVEDKTFEIQMNELHQEFFKKIKQEFPNLSNNDLRLCAYIRVGLNSKEIADILNIQPSSSYISRSRLRKKLNLKTEDDLYDFLNRF